MSRHQKAIDRLKTKPKDFTWAEVQAIMTHLGFVEQKGSGSSRKFINGAGLIIALHQPHPTSILKEYQLKILIEALKGIGI